MIEFDVLYGTFIHYPRLLLIFIPVTAVLQVAGGFDVYEERGEIRYLDGTVQGILQSTAGGRGILRKECALVPDTKFVSAAMDCGGTTV